MSGFRDPRPHWADPIEGPEALKHPSPLAFVAVRLAISIAAAATLCLLVLSLVKAHP